MRPTAAKSLRKRIPLKRHKSLQAMSKEHHYILLFCWKLRQGIKNQISLARIQKYINWVYEKYLSRHFAMEKSHILPLLPHNSTLKLRVKKDTDRIETLIKNIKLNESKIINLEQSLVSLVRLEEREVYHKIQEQNDLDSLDCPLNTLAPFKHWAAYTDEF